MRMRLEGTDRGVGLWANGRIELSGPAGNHSIYFIRRTDQCQHESQGTSHAPKAAIHEGPQRNTKKQFATEDSENTERSKRHPHAKAQSRKGKSKKTISATEDDEESRKQFATENSENTERSKRTSSRQGAKPQRSQKIDLSTKGREGRSRIERINEQSDCPLGFPCS